MSSDPYGITRPSSSSKITSIVGIPLPLSVPRRSTLSPCRPSVRLAANGYGKVNTAMKSGFGCPPAGYVLPADARAQDVINGGPIQG